MKVSDILAAKNAKPFSIPPDRSVQALCAFLKEKRVGAAVVSGDGKVIDGIITERDIAFALATHGAALAALPVSSLMTKDVITCGPDDDPGRVASTMLSRSVRHIPVSDNGRFVGMVSIRDVLKERVAELQEQTAQLRGLAMNRQTVPQDR